MYCLECGNPGIQDVSYKAPPGYAPNLEHYLCSGITCRNEWYYLPGHLVTRMLHPGMLAKGEQDLLPDFDIK